MPAKKVKPAVKKETATVNKRWNENRKGKQLAGSKVAQSTAKPNLKKADFLQTTTSHALNDSKEIIAASLEHFSGDYEAVANALEVPIAILQTIENSTDQAFTSAILKEVSRHYRKRVVVSDPLTGLLNRSAFLLEVSDAIKAKQEFSIIFIDLDKFKPVNDTYGHKIGDKLLQSVGNRIKDCVPKSSKICRLGGDEYCVLIPKEEIKNGAELFKNSIDTELKLPFNFTDVKDDIYISASLGVSYFPESGSTAETLLEAADLAMYEDKKNYVENENIPLPVSEHVLYYLTISFGILLSIGWVVTSLIIG